MGTKPPSDLSQSWMEETSSGPQLRSHGPVAQQCPSCKRETAVCLCTTPSTSSGSGGSSNTRRTRPRKRAQPADRAEPTPACRQLFPTDNVEPEPGPSRSRHTCPQCPKTFCTPGKLSQHLFVHTGERPFSCQHCDKAFSSRFKLVRHTLIHSDQRQYRCLVCDRTFHRKDHLKNHSKVHSPIKRVYKCERENCGKEYSSPISYRKHVAVHAAEDGNLECTICGIACETKEDIVLHLKIHAGSRSVKTQADRKYRCDQCDRSFFTGKDVRRHLVVHTGKRDFLCQFCPQRFGRKDHLVRHIRKSHNHTGKKGKKKPEPKTKTVTSILEEASTSQATDAQEEHKSESRSSFGIFDDEDTDVPSTSVEIFKPDSKDLTVHFSRSDDMLSETSGSMMSDHVYQSPPPPYPLTGLTLDPSPAGSVLDIKPEVMSEYITLLPHQFGGTLPPNMVLTTAESTDTLTLPFEESERESSLHDQFLQMCPNFIEGSTAQSSTSSTDITIPDIIEGFLTSTDTPTSSTPLPRFNQAFHQPP